MGDEEARHRLSDLVLGFEGLAIMRNFWLRPDVVAERVAEIEDVLSSRANDPDLSYEDHVSEVDLVSGYDRWAATYDLPSNPIVVADDRLLHPLLDGLDGLIGDIACGTGRHASYLRERSKEVVAFDRSFRMTRTTADKGTAVVQADLQRLPLRDGALDAAVCSLALAHFEDLSVPLQELARVVRSNGRFVISDLHPMTIASGAHASFEDETGTRGVMRNYLHLHSDYLRAFETVGLEVTECLETRWSDTEIELLTLERFPGLVPSALEGLAIILAWDLKVREA